MQTIIVAFGGNALIKNGQSGSCNEQLANLTYPMQQIARISKQYKIVLTHGNGPQVGQLILQQENTESIQKKPLDILVAETQGQIGYMMELTLDNELMKIGVTDPLISTILTYVLVNKDDPAFFTPTKPVGPAFKAKKEGFVQTSKGWRKVVPSPNPTKIIVWREIKTLVDNGFIVITCGGGGIPVVREQDTYTGIECVIDKDLASAKLGEQIDADLLLIATEVEKVALHYQTPREKRLDTITVSQAKRYLKEGHFPAGSMGPKIQAAINFVESGKEKAIITSIDTIEQALLGKAGTVIVQ